MRKSSSTSHGDPSIVILAGLLILFLGGCGGSGVNSHTLSPARSAMFTLAVLPDSYIQGGSASAVELAVAQTADGFTADVVATGAQGLKALYFDLVYDPRQYHVESAEATPRLGAPAATLVLALLTDPGVVHFGVILQRPQERRGFTGDGVLARVHLQRGAAAETRHVSAPPTTNTAAALASWDPASSTLYWWYSHPGDCNQDSMTGITDLTPLGVHFGETGPFDNLSAQAAVDTNQDGIINAADLAAIGMNFGRRISEYNVYGGGGPADKPGNAAPSILAPLATLAFSAASNFTQRQTERLCYSFTDITGPLSDYYWVRPADGGAEGTPSYYITEHNVDASLTLTGSVPTWVTGTGTAADPYTNPGLYHAADLQTRLVLTDATDGNVSSSAGVNFYVDPPVATVSSDIWRNLLLEDALTDWGAFTITANYKGKYARAWFNIRRQVALTISNPGVLGHGTQADPFLVDIYTTYNLLTTDLTDGDVSGGTDSFPGGWTEYGITGTAVAPEDAGSRYGIWYKKDSPGNTASIGFEDSFAGGPENLCAVQARYQRDRLDGQGNPYSQDAVSNTLYFQVANPGLWPADQFTMYKDDQGNPLYLGSVHWLSATEGYGCYDGSDNWTTWADLYHTTDGGATWSLVNRIQGRGDVNGASFYVSLWGDQMWYSTYFSGMGIAGTAGYSTTNGATWNNAEVAIQTAWANPELYSFPIGPVTRLGSQLWVTGCEGLPNVACSDNGGGTWWSPDTTGLSWISLAGTSSNMLLRATNGATQSWYRWNQAGTVFEPWEAALPADCPPADAKWVSSPQSSALAIVKSNAVPYYVLVSPDAGHTMQQVYHISVATPQDIVPYTALALSTGEVYMTGYKPEGTMVSGAVGHQQVLKTTDGGAHWTLLLSQYSSWTGVGTYNIGLSLDDTNNLYLTRISSGAPYSGLEAGRYVIGVGP